MTRKRKNGSRDPGFPDPDILNATAAMIRAASRARERARQAGIGVVVLENGRIVEETSPSAPRSGAESK